MSRALDPAAERLVRRWSQGIGACLVGLLGVTGASVAAVLGGRPSWSQAAGWLSVLLMSAGVWLAASAMRRLRRLERVGMGARGR